MGRKTLAFMYIAESHGFYGQKFNFSTKEKFDVKVDDESKLFLSREIYNHKLPNNFWGDNISEMSLLVGQNGAGKTTVMRTICLWLCYLSEKRIPKETGILVFKEDDTLKYVAFAEGEEIQVSTDIQKMELYENGYYTNFFEDIQLVYYSNTMTELKIDGCGILEDYSMPTRMKKANASGHAMGDEIIMNYECYEFQQQIAVALEEKKFPIDYILLEIRKYSSEEIESLLLHHKKDIFKELNNLLEGDSKRDGVNKESDTEFLKFNFLHGFFTGILVKILKWGKKYQCAKRNNVEDVLYNLFLGHEMIKCDDFTSNKVYKIKEFIKDLLYGCDEAYQNSSYIKDYRCYWKNTEYYVNNVIDFIVNKQNINFLNGWTIESVMKKGDEEKCIWKMHLKENKKIYKCFWSAYSQIAFRIENIHFSWDASSGQQSWAGLFSELKGNRISKNYGNIWYLLDEPDNTFHPEWERKLINQIIKTLNDNGCNKQVWITTHSPIMLSDMPGQAVTYLIKKKGCIGEKKVVEKEKFTFGQNIYVLYNDAFFLQNGVIGEFASSKIVDTVLKLEKIEKILSNNNKSKQQLHKKLKKISRKIDKYEEIVALVVEPAFRHQMEYYLKNCRKLVDKVMQSDQNKYYG